MSKARVIITVLGVACLILAAVLGWKIHSLKSLEEEYKAFEDAMTRKNGKFISVKGKSELSIREQMNKSCHDHIRLSSKFGDNHSVHTKVDHGF